MVPWGGRERRLSVTVVPLPGLPERRMERWWSWTISTPLMRAQKIAAWGEVARKLAHEIKNPLTPIQLSAQRIRRAYVKSAPGLEGIITACTTAIVDEVEALRNLVDEFSQFARLPAAHLAPTSLADVIEQALSLYDGLFPEVRLERRLDPDIPPVRLDSAQIKRALLNLIDNAIDATDRKGRVEVQAELDRRQGCVRLVVADDGARHRRRGPGPAVRAALLHQEARQRPGAVDRQPDRAGAQWDDPGRGRVPHGARFIIEIPV